MSQVPNTFDEVIKEIPKSVREVEKLPLHLMLMVVGGALAILLGFVIVIIEIALGYSVRWWWVGAALIPTLISIILGALLIFSFIVCKRDLSLGSILGGVFSIVLLAEGGIAGLIGGLLGLIGAIIAFVKYLERPQPAPKPSLSKPPSHPVISNVSVGTTSMSTSSSPSQPGACPSCKGQLPLMAVNCPYCGTKVK